MIFFLKVFIAIAVAVLLGGLLTYPAWLLVDVFGNYRPDRVMHRVGQIILALALWWILRQEGKSDRHSFGYGIPRSIFLRQMGVGFLTGIVLMVPPIAVLLWMGVRTLNSVADQSVVLVIAEGLIAGFAIAFIEETLVRGAMFGAMARESGFVVAVILTSLLFAAAHFLRGALRIDAGEMDVGSGLRLAADMFSQYRNPLQLADAFFALFSLGVLLGLIRARTGAIAGSIGVHAGGVTMIFIVSKWTVENPSSSPQWLVPSYNYVVGWLLFVWIALIASVYWSGSKDSRAKTTRLEGS